MTVEDGLTWLPLQEAAVRLGKSSDAVRSLVRRDRLTARKRNNGGLLVAVPTDLDRSGDGQPTAGGRSADGQMTAELRDTIAELQAELLEARVAQARAEAERDGLRATAAAETAALNVLVTELRADLAEARRPWWRRWVG
jgi:hypothetical protein